MKVIECEVGIYSTEYSLYKTRFGWFVKAPYIKWVGNSGNLDFIKVKIDEKLLPTVLKFFEAGKLMIESGDSYIDLDYVLGV